MILIKRDNVCPEIKDRKGNCKITLELNRLKAKYIANPADYNSGAKIFSFDNSIYGHSDIKEKLIRTQFGKCAFCESNIPHITYGDVEHFRPKGGIQQNDRSKMIKPGYYWLAYEWDNLLFVCGICNQRFKKNYFPLRNLERRALNHSQSINVRREKPFFINPAKENPKFLIRFNEATAVGIDKNHRGKKTIESLGLNRKGKAGISDLYEMRLKDYRQAKIIHQVSTYSPSSEISQSQIDDAKVLMREFRNPRNQYSAMIRDNFPV